MRGLVVLRRITVLALLALVVAGPELGATEVATTSTRQVTIIMVVDRTKSMDALDLSSGPRVARLRSDLTELVRSLPRARFALISFATRAKVDVPLTGDLAVVEDALARLDLEDPLQAEGSRLDRPLEKVRTLVEQAVDHEPDGSTSIVMASDGENTDDGVQASYAPIGRLVSDGVVLGYGTEDGGRMTLAGGRDLSEGFVPQRNSQQPAISRLDPTNLRSVADELGVPYVQRDTATGIDAIAARLGADTVESTTIAGRDLTWLFAVLLVLLALLELRSSWRGLLRTARQRGRS